MNNEYLDIILLTALFTLLFIVFFISSYRELKKISKSGFQGKKETGPRADMIRYIGEFFNDTSVSTAEKQNVPEKFSRSIEKQNK